MSDPDAALLPKFEFDKPETSDLGVAPAQFEKDTIENNYWWLRQRRQGDTEATYLGNLSETIYGDPRAYIAKAPAIQPDPANPGIGVGAGKDASIRKMFEDAARLRETMPGEFANLPASYDELKARVDATVRTELQEEMSDADAALANRSDPNFVGGVASFGGSMAAGITDAEGVVTLPFGAAGTGLARTMLIESFLGGAGAAMQIPGQQRQAEFLGTTAPDPVLQVLSGMAFGAALPLGGRAIKLAANSLTPSGRLANRDLLQFGRRTDATPAERGATAALGRQEAGFDTAPDGVTATDHAARIEAAATDLENDAPNMVRASDVIPDTEAPNPDLSAPKGDGTPPKFDFEPGGNAAPDANQVGYVFGKLLDRGATPEQAAALLGNLMQESGKGLNTGAIGDNGNAIGMGQWNGPRKRQLMRFADAKGVDWRDLDTQIEFLWRELNGSERGAWEKIKSAPDAATAAKIASEQFWRPGLPHLSNRMAFARMVYDQYANGQVPKGGSPGRWRNPGDDAQATGLTSFDPRDLGTDAVAYQYKLGGDRYGVTDRLQGEREWDARAAVGVIVHERLDGSRYIADGHQRLGLANRLLERGQSDIRLDGFLLREADGFTVEEVRALAALKNIRAESGTPLDAAKVMRDNPQLISQISRSRPFMAQAQGLADLAPGPFQAVVNDVIPQNYGAIVGRIIPDDDQIQGVAIATLAKTRPANETQAESIIRDIRRLGLEKRADDAQMDMFGDGFDLRQTVISERAQVIDKVIKEARADRALFSRLEKQAEHIQEAGNVLNRSENATRAELAEQVLARVLILADQPGPVRDAIDSAAKSLRSGTKLDAAARDVFDALGRAADASEGKGAGVRTAGGGDAGAAVDADLPQPKLLDLPADSEARIEPGLFDDPIEDAAETARLTTLERELSLALDDPKFDLDLPTGGSDAPTLSLRAQRDALAEEADFVDALKTLCLT